MVRVREMVTVIAMVRFRVRDNVSSRVVVMVKVRDRFN